MGMAGENTESTDVPATEGDAEVFNLGTVFLTSKGIAFASARSGVVFRQHGIEGTSYHVITVGLDSEGWRQASAGDYEGWEMAYTAVEQYRVDGSSRAMGQSS